MEDLVRTQAAPELTVAQFSQALAELEALANERPLLVEDGQVRGVRLRPGVVRGKKIWFLGRRDETMPYWWVENTALPLFPRE